MTIGKQTGWISAFNDIPVQNRTVKTMKNRLKIFLQTEWEREADRICAATKNKISKIFN